MSSPKTLVKKVVFDFFTEEQHMMSSLSNSRSGIRIIRAYVVLLGRRHMLFFKQANFTVIKAYYNFCDSTAASSQGRKHVNSLQHCFRGHWQGSSLETSPLFLQLADTALQRGCKNHIVSSSNNYVKYLMATIEYWVQYAEITARVQSFSRMHELPSSIYFITYSTNHKAYTS